MSPVDVDPMGREALPVILCGGSGTRLWPLSRSRFPKQFHAIHGELPLLTATVARVRGLPGGAGVVAVCNDEIRFLVASQLDAAGAEDGVLLLEPEPRGTAAAVAAAACRELAEGRDPVLLVLPADHLIRDEPSFRNSLCRGMDLAAEGWLVTFGVHPLRAETGYGYIVGGQHLVGGAGRRVREFVEKPDQARARRLIDSGEAWWNSGIFAFRASRFLAELERHNRPMAAACRQAVAGMSRDMRFVRLDAGAWHDCPTDSIDYAVMEKTTDAVVLPLESDWSDIGSWEGVWEAGEADADGNVVNGDIRTHDVAGTLIWGGERLVVAEGVRDLVIVDSDDAVLVCRRGGSQDVRDIVTALRADSRPEAEQHRTVHRPWGSYRSIDRGTNFQVKRLVLEPGASISLQRHSRRAEHWVVVCGLARVTRGAEVLLLTPNQSTYIPVGTVHRLENASDGVLEVIEVQTGDYLGEDDIERFDDEYGRLDKARQAAAK